MGCRFAERKVFVTSSTRGLGLGIAAYLAGEGAHVVVTGREESSANRVANTIRRQGGVAYGQAMNLGVPEQIQSAIQEAAERMGGLDILVTNAGGPPTGDVRDISDDVWVRSFELTVLSVIRLVHAAEPYLLKSNGPRIAAIVSSSVKQPIDRLAVSNVLRPSVAALIKHLSGELAPHILINGVAPGRIRTERVQTIDEERAKRQEITVQQQVEQTVKNIPVGRYGEPEELARVVGFLTSTDNTYVTGQVIMVDGGMVRAL